MEPSEQYSKLKEIAHARNASNLALGEYLYELKRTKGYKNIAGKDATFTSFLADPELKISQATAYRYMRVYERYILELGYTYQDLYGLDIATLYRVASVINDDNKAEWMSNIRSLSRSDIISLITGEKEDPCHGDHDFKTHTLKCIRCGASRRAPVGNHGDS